jgi:hypothetical protein
VVAFSLEKPGNIRMTLVDLTGNPLMSVASGDFSSGSHKVAIKSSTLKPGMYLLKIEILSNGNISSGMIKIVVSN